MEKYAQRNLHNQKGQLMTCSVEGCNRDIKYKGMCGMHYKRLWRHGNVSTSIIPHKLEEIRCQTEDCTNIIEHSSGYCKIHRQRFHRYGRHYNIIAPRGAGGFDSNGYYVISVNGRRVLEHIYKAEQALGKPLPKGAIVHHMNGVKYDNDTPLNLVVCPNQAYHLL